MELGRGAARAGTQLLGLDRRTPCLARLAVWDNGTLVFSCGRLSRKARDLLRDPRIVVHLESGAEVVIVEGTAGQIEPTLGLIEAYSAKYGPTSSEVGDWYRVTPRRVLAWREEDYPRSATRFDL